MLQGLVGKPFLLDSCFVGGGVGVDVLLESATVCDEPLHVAGVTLDVVLRAYIADALMHCKQVCLQCLALAVS